MTRRDAARNLFLWMCGSPLVRGQQQGHTLAERLPNIEDLVNVFEFEPVARARIPRNSYDFIAGGVDDEWTLERNREGFRRITFRPRMLVDVSRLDLSLELFGRKLEMPILIAPTAAHQLAHPDGELATVRGAGAAKTVMVVSSNASYPIEKIGAAATSPFWFQLYAGPDEEGTRERVERALASGALLVCLTVDTQYNSHRERLLRNRISSGTPPGVSAQTPARRSPRQAAQPPNPYRLGQQFTATLTWSFFDQLRSWVKAPLIIKGILTPEDARLAIEHGADGIVVSNHGGRYLEATPSTIEVLPAIVDAVAGKIPVLIDGGFRRGTDILKALALGAKAVLVGRPVLWGLAAYGSPGVRAVLEMLQNELALAMGLSGKPNLAAVDRALVKIHRL